MSKHVKEDPSPTSQPELGRMRSVIQPRSGPGEHSLETRATTPSTDAVPSSEPATQCSPSHRVMEDVVSGERRAP